MEKMDFQERVRRRNEFDASIVYGTRQFNLLTRRQEHMAFREDNDDLWIDKKKGVKMTPKKRKYPKKIIKLPNGIEGKLWRLWYNEITPNAVYRWLRERYERGHK